ncbi:MAG: galactose-1-phosphate uridylyltransferase [Bifidobacteriaceae bacterium]|jgi:UDPglucose--hexose-1-phosphate uridylyltransferase|nr:galactose-1-phosphate uridylyltransferase [Bifidobacteriaceae bacterium]
MTIRITPTHLADGREFFYFDDSPDYASGAKTRRLDDPRPLRDRNEPVQDQETGDLVPPTGPEMRFDSLTGEWIPMASHRMNRTFEPVAAACPLCPASPGRDYQDGEIPDTDYDVVVFENRFPSYWRPSSPASPLDQSSPLRPSAAPGPSTTPGSPATPCPPAVPGSPGTPGEPVHGLATERHLQDQELWRARPAAGRCEVICFSPDHTAQAATLSDTRMRTVIEAWATRTAALQATDGIAQVYPFENRGPEIGVTLPHPHGQLYGYPTLTPKTATMMRQAADHRKRTGRHLLADIVAAEARGPRLVLESDHWLAYVPFAARWPVEVHLAPRRGRLDFTELDPPERDDLARIYPRLLRGLDRFFIDADGLPIPLPYISAWHQAPVDPQVRPLGRLHMQLFSIRRAPGKLKYLAGSESGMGAWVSDTTPERIATRLRAALAESAGHALDAHPAVDDAAARVAGAPS